MASRERPLRIRTMLVAGDKALAEAVQLLLADAFPIELVEIVASAQQCRRMLPEADPDVLLIADLPGAGAFQLAREVALNWPEVAAVILSGAETADAFRAAFAAGARGVVKLGRQSGPAAAWVISREELETQINQAAELVRIRSGRGPSADGQLTGRVIVIYSAKGGVGKSLIAASLAQRLAMLNPAGRILLMDLNLQFSTLPILANLEPAHTIFDLVPIAAELNQRVVNDLIQRKELPEQRTLYILPAPNEPRQADQVGQEHVQALLTGLRRYFNFLVVDTTSVISDLTLTALQAAQHILLVCIPDVLSISQIGAALRLLRDPQLGIPRDALGLVINQVADKANRRPAGEIPTETIQSLFDLPLLGQVPFDPDYARALTGGTLATGIAAAAQTYRALVGIDGIIASLGYGPPVASPQDGGRSRLLRARA